jgi:hypothetical protein
MKNRLLRPVTLIALSAAALSLTPWAVASAPRQSAQATQTDETKRKTLRELARERDVECVTYSEDEVEYDDVRQLARAAEAIVVGRVSAAEADFSSDDYIATTYTIEVGRIIKDTQLKAPLLPDQPQPAPLAKPLKLARAGGEVRVNGHRASQRFEGETLAAGGEYVLFLWWSPSSDAYYLAGGSSGAFLVNADQSLSPLGTKAGMLRHKGGGLQAVIDEILAAR